jgi:hypothetical protein
MPTITDFSRVNILYTDDFGTQRAVPQRAACQIAVGNTVTTNSSLPGRPAKWKLRHIYVVTPTTGKPQFRKRIVIGSTSNGLWNTATGQTVSIDGTTWKVEGRLGEKREVTHF